MKMEIAFVILGLLLGVIGFKVGTALFSDISLSEKNKISTGEFDVRISKTGDRFYNDLKLFELDNLKPGDEALKIAEFIKDVSNRSKIQAEVALTLARQGKIQEAFKIINDILDDDVKTWATSKLASELKH